GATERGRTDSRQSDSRLRQPGLAGRRTPRGRLAFPRHQRGAPGTRPAGAAAGPRRRTGRRCHRGAGSERLVRPTGPVAAALAVAQQRPERGAAAPARTDYGLTRSAGRRAPATSLSTARAAATMPKLAVTIIEAPKPPAQSSRTPSPTKPLLWQTPPAASG